MVSKGEVRTREETTRGGEDSSGSFKDTLTEGMDLELS